MEKPANQPDNPGMTTKTELLLRQARDICCRVTGRPDPGDDLLAEVFRHLQLETGLFDDYDDSDDAPPPDAALH